MVIGTVMVGKKKHRIIRTGKRKEQGGKGTSWACSCKPDGMCYVVLALFNKIIDMNIIKLTVDGKRIFASRFLN